MKLLWIVLILTGMIAGCGEKSSYENTYRPRDYSDLKSELEKAQFNCSTATCPENVGLILINTNDSQYSPELAQCTGFLVADDIVATNSHCLPDYLKVSRSYCESRIAIRFITSSGKKNIFLCKEVIDYSKRENVFSADFAFIRIESTGLSPFQIHKDGIKDNEKLKIVKATPLLNLPGAKLDVEECKVALNTLLNPLGTNSWAKTAVGMNCHGTQGNSGSPVIGENGKVLGILQSMMTQDWVNGIQKSFSHMKLPDEMPPHIVFTNLSCVNDPVTKVSNQEKCLVGEKLGLDDCVDFNTGENAKLNNEKVSKIIKNWQKDLPSIFLYEYITEEGKGISAHPTCVKPKGKFADYDKYVSNSGIFGLRKLRVKTEAPISLVIDSNPTVDHEFKLAPTLNYREKIRSTFHIELVKESEFWKGTMHSDFTNQFLRIDLRDLKVQMTLSECTDVQLDAPEISKVKTKDGTILSEKEYLNQQETSKKTCEK